MRVDELMDLARRDATDPAALHREPVDLVGLVASVLDGYRVSNDRHIFVVDPGIDSLVGQWDRDRIERAVDNLVNNAIKFSPHGGRISASISEVRSAEKHEAVLTIADEGVGIPDDEHAAIFTRFRRGSNAANVPGSGVGLWSVRRIIEEHGGTLAVRSRVGEGSTFTICLPIAAPEH